MVGLVEVSSEGVGEEELYERAIECGAQDIEVGESAYIIYTSPEELYRVKECLESSGLSVERAETTYKPTTTVRIEDVETAKKLLKLLDALDELDDVQKVIANFDMPEEILKSLE